MFEAARRWSEKRSWIPSPQPQDARFDVTAEARTEIVRKSRYFEANSAIVNRLADLYEQFTIGPQGLQINPASSSEEWNTAAKTWWDEWSRVCDLTSRLSLGTLQTICARSQFVDGEIFILKTAGEEIVEGGRVVRRPRIQLIETHRIETPADRYADQNIIDGVKVDSRGRPVSYFIRERSANGEERHAEKDANLVIPVSEPGRPGQLRCLPFLYPVLNDLHDLDDLQMLCLQKAKDNASTTRVVKTMSGEMPSASDILRGRATVTTKNSSGEDVSVERTRQIQTVFGARSVALKTGEDFQEYTNNTPSLADRELWSHLTSRVCIGVGIPKILVFPESVQGTVARGDFDVANAFFRSRSAIHQQAWTEVYYYVMDWAIRNVPELKNAPKDWRNVTVCPPRAVNVDVGYQSAAVLADLEAGIETYASVYGKLGKDYRSELRQKAKEAKMIRDLAEEFGVEVSEISTVQQDRTERIAAIKADIEQLKQEDTESLSAAA